MHFGTQTADVHAADVVDSRKRIKAIIASSSGNLVEWYDFYVYSFGALYFASAFFPKGDQTTQLLSAASVFAVGFLMRPVGSWIFGRLADRKGRKTSMVTSVLIMCAGSLLVAIMPTYNSIGVWAPALLTLARMLPGVSVGGEYGTSATYMSEVALAKHRGFLASFQYVTLIGGQLLALLVLLVLQSVMTRDEISAWGWRIPFFIGALAALVAFYLRSGLHETANASMLHMNKKDGHRQGIAGLTLAALGIVYGIGTSPLYAMKETFNALAVKHQLQVLDRSRRRAPRLTPWDRLVLGLCICCIPIKRLAKCAVILKPSSLTRLHHDYRLAAVAD